MLLEYTRVRRKPRDLGCAFYREVHFRERQRPAISVGGTAVVDAAIPAGGTAAAERAGGGSGASFNGSGSG